MAVNDGVGQQRELFLSEVNNRETIAAIEANNDMHCLQTRIEKFPLIHLILFWLKIYCVMLKLKLFAFIYREDRCKHNSKQQTQYTL